MNSFVFHRRRMQQQPLPSHATIYYLSSLSFVSTYAACSHFVPVASIHHRPFRFTHVACSPASLIPTHLSRMQRSLWTLPAGASRSLACSHVPPTPTPTPVNAPCGQCVGHVAIIAPMRDNARAVCGACGVIGGYPWGLMPFRRM